MRKFVATLANKVRTDFFRFTKFFLKSIAVGLSITLILHVLAATDFMRSLLQGGLDWTMGINAGTQSGSGSGQSAKDVYSFVCIDQSLYREWGEPPLTPRDRIADLLRNIMAGDPRLIIVDIDLTRPSPDPHQDGTLREFLAGLGAVPPSQRPPIILVKSVQISDKSDATLPPFLESFLDDIVFRTPGIYWASPMFTEDKDHVIRYWRLAECSETELGPRALPSVQLLAYALLDQDTASGPTRYAELLRQLENAKGLCRTGDSRESDDGGLISIGALSFPSSEQVVENRIFYSLRPDLPTQAIADNGTVRPVLLSVPARTLLDRDSGHRLKDLLDGRIVIVGGNYSDIHATPIGDMPGAMIILNAIRSLSLYGIAREPSMWTTVAIEAVLILAMSVCFMLFHSFWGMVLSNVLILIVLVPINIVVYRYGVWLDFVLPLIAVLFHHMHENLKETKERRLESNES